MNILVVNVGSTSFKYRLLAMPEEIVTAEGRLERIGGDESPVAFAAGDHSESGTAHLPDYAAAIGRMMKGPDRPGQPAAVAGGDWRRGVQDRASRWHARLLSAR